MGATVPGIYANSGLGPALLLGSAICVFSLINAFGLISIDKWAESK